MGVVRLAATRASAADLAKLRERLGANRDAIGSIERFGQTDIDFHAAIAAIGGNAIINAFFEALDQWLREVRRTSLRGTGQMETPYAAHQRILDALEARDPNRSAHEMFAHLKQLARIYP